MTEWTNTEDEYPPCDGWYLIPYASLGLGEGEIAAYYDGFGFIHHDRYVKEPELWTYLLRKREKQYGKSNK